MQNIKITVGILIVVAVSAIAIFAATKPAPPSTSPEPVACTEEAKLCPDGSYVGRTGPQCQFSACPANTPASTPRSTAIVTPAIPTVSPKTTSGISGTVMLGPSCPVMRNPPDPQCADKPYKAALVVTTPDGSRVVAEFSSDAAGKFKVSLPPGEYIIRSASTTNFYPRCSSTDNVIVKAGIFTDAAVSCDTGIR